MDWWNQITVRDQRILMLGGITLGAMFLYVFAWQPFAVEKQTLQQQLREQRESLQWMQQAALEIQALQTQQQPHAASRPSTSLLTLVDQSLRDNAALRNLNKRIEPSGDTQVRVDFTAVNFNDLLQWLTQLHNQHQININSLNLERLTQEGQVKAYIRLERLS